MKNKLHSRSLARLIFIEYIYVNLVGAQQIEITELLEELPKLFEQDEFFFCKELLDQLLTGYDQNQIKIVGEIENNPLLIAILQAAITESRFADKALIISEYLALADLFDIKHTIVHAVLEKSIQSIKINI